jgi:hypothetical protein
MTGLCRSAVAEADGGARWRAVGAGPSRPASPTSVVDDDTELAVVQSDSELGNLFIAEALDHLGTIEASCSSSTSARKTRTC